MNVINKNKPLVGLILIIGGAAGYCPRVRQVTYRSSTSIVPFKYLATRQDMDWNKEPAKVDAEKFEYTWSEIATGTEPAEYNALVHSWRLN